jgi:hypothetical protein
VQRTGWICALAFAALGAVAANATLVLPVNGQSLAGRALPVLAEASGIDDAGKRPAESMPEKLKMGPARPLVPFLTSADGTGASAETMTPAPAGDPPPAPFVTRRTTPNEGEERSQTNVTTGRPSSATVSNNVDGARWLDGRVQEESVAPILPGYAAPGGESRFLDLPGLFFGLVLLGIIAAVVMFVKAGSARPGDARRSLYARAFQVHARSRSRHRHSSRKHGGSRSGPL